MFVPEFVAKVYIEKLWAAQNVPGRVLRGQKWLFRGEIFYSVAKGGWLKLSDQVRTKQCVSKRNSFYNKYPTIYNSRKRIREGVTNDTIEYKRCSKNGKELKIRLYQWNKELVGKNHN